MINGYLYNNWYKLRLQRNGSNHIRYILERTNGVELSNTTTAKLNGDFSSFSKVEWYSDYEPIVCPMFFWDDHKVGLIEN